MYAHFLLQQILGKGEQRIYLIHLKYIPSKNWVVELIDGGFPWQGTRLLALFPGPPCIRQNKHWCVYVFVHVTYTHLHASIPTQIHTHICTHEYTTELHIHHMHVPV